MSLKGTRSFACQRPFQRPCNLWLRSSKEAVCALALLEEEQVPGCPAPPQRITETWVSLVFPFFPGFYPHSAKNYFSPFLQWLDGVMVLVAFLATHFYVSYYSCWLLLRCLSPENVPRRAKLLQSNLSMSSSLCNLQATTCSYNSIRSLSLSCH